MTVLKTDRILLKKYLNGKTIKTALHTPLKNVRAYTTEDNRIIFVATQSKKDEVSTVMALIASKKGWNLSVNTEGSYLVCLLYP